MAEIGLRVEEVKSEVDKINTLAKNVEENARELVNVAKKISNKGIQGFDWYTGTFQQMLAKLEGNKVSEAVAEIKLQGQKLVQISESTIAYSNNQE